MEDIKFSVLVPVYNAEKFLDECIKSVLGQTYQNFELILVDDGSTDRSGVICDKYALENSRIKVVHKENQGLVLARRDGIKRSTGDYLMFLDSDDCYREDALELICKSIKKTECDLVLFNVSKKEGFVNKDWSFGFFDGQVFTKENKEIIYKKVITSSVLNNLSLKAVKKCVVDVEKDYSDFSFVTSGEDLLQSLPIIDKAEKIVYIDEALYFYRQHQESMVHNFNCKSFFSIKAVYEVLTEYIKKWKKEELLCKHYSNRIVAVIMYSSSIVLSHNTSKKEKAKRLLQLSKDKFFTDAYGIADKSILRKRELFLVNLLYRGKIKRFYTCVVLRKYIGAILAFFRG
jgi:glycosyltransferase involved in cell wall biosynthesis